MDPGLFDAGWPMKIIMIDVGGEDEDSHDRLSRQPPETRSG